MAKRVKRRLQALEQRQKPNLGWRIFSQSREDPELWYEGGNGREHWLPVTRPPGEKFTEAEIDGLAEQGYLVQKIKYKGNGGPILVVGKEEIPIQFH